ncbi:hypothetical protein BO83DRAFT_454322 [Aspergillus eucalypticola CBS 122712]|uniref:Condensation domain-containing protein n=1 Tax=Aspergillus eucalypticola (strain CBS 122712 / IBT 29274) TaxID=1448314 RepID=A0A317W778_ASPEC|nr:uncharacterized protein BO83DRAFT_454322 [Aspergillus eucalypticola CBS 122712]PWY82506.1 hypothetical protein BO83DRAFT_454322 [Aspergillus eucalypticola CBS 122712]
MLICRITFTAPTVRRSSYSTEILKPWGRVSEKQYTRPLDGMEAVMRQISISHPPGRRTYDVAAAVKAQTRLTADELIKKGRLAWQNLRYKHPLMASSTVDRNRIYNVPYGKELEAWTQKTFKFMPLGTVEIPMLLHLKDRNEFMLKLAHCHSDAQGITLWFHDFLNELSCPNTDTVRWKPGEEVKNLPLGTCDAVDIPRLPQSWVEDHRGFFPKKQLKAPRTLGLVTEPEASQRQSAYEFERHRFSARETKTIIAGARKLGLTLTPFSHTAITLAAKKKENLPDGVQHNTFLVSSLRGQCKGPPELGSHAVGLRFGLWPIQVGIHEFSRTSKALMKCYSSFKNNMTSNMGDCSPYIQASYGEIELDDYWAINLPANSSVFFIIETRLGQLEMRACYNSAFYDPPRIRSLIDSACKIFLDASTCLRNHAMDGGMKAIHFLSKSHDTCIGSQKTPSQNNDQNLHEVQTTPDTRSSGSAAAA